MGARPPLCLSPFRSRETFQKGERGQPYFRYGSSQKLYNHQHGWFLALVLNVPFSPLFVLGINPPPNRSDRFGVLIPRFSPAVSAVIFPDAMRLMCHQRERLHPPQSRRRRRGLFVAAKRRTDIQSRVRSFSLSSFFFSLSLSLSLSLPGATTH